MTREQWNKHKEAIQWFMDQPEGTEIWYKDGIWNLTIEPMWSIEYTYVINDEYAELEKALIDGKQIQWKPSNSDDWEDVDFIPRPDKGVSKWRVRIKPDEPEFKVGDWVVVETTGSITPIVCKLTSILDKACTVKGLHTYKGSMSDILSLWQPAEGELVVCNYRNGRCIVEPYDPNDTDYYTIQPLIYDFTIYK